MREEQSTKIAKKLLKLYFVDVGLHLLIEASRGKITENTFLGLYPEFKCVRDNKDEYYTGVIENAPDDLMSKLKDSELLTISSKEWDIYNKELKQNDTYNICIIPKENMLVVEQVLNIYNDETISPEFKEQMINERIDNWREIVQDSQQNKSGELVQDNKEITDEELVLVREHTLDENDEEEPEGTISEQEDDGSWLEEDEDEEIVLDAEDKGAKKESKKETKTKSNSSEKPSEYAPNETSVYSNVNNEPEIYNDESLISSIPYTSESSVEQANIDNYINSPAEQVNVDNYSNETSEFQSAGAPENNQEYNNVNDITEQTNNSELISPITANSQGNEPDSFNSFSSTEEISVHDDTHQITQERFDEAKKSYESATIYQETKSDIVENQPTTANNSSNIYKDSNADNTVYYSDGKNVYEVVSENGQTQHIYKHDNCIGVAGHFNQEKYDSKTEEISQQAFKEDVIQKGKNVYAYDVESGTKLSNANQNTILVSGDHKRSNPLEDSTINKNGAHFTGSSNFIQKEYLKESVNGSSHMFKTLVAGTMAAAATGSAYERDRSQVKSTVSYAKSLTKAYAGKTENLTLQQAQRLTNTNLNTHIKGNIGTALNGSGVKIKSLGSHKLNSAFDISHNSYKDILNAFKDNGLISMADGKIAVTSKFKQDIKAKKGLNVTVSGKKVKLSKSDAKRLYNYVGNQAKVSLKLAPKNIGNLGLGARLGAVTALNLRKAIQESGDEGLRQMANLWNKANKGVNLVNFAFDKNIMSPKAIVTNTLRAANPANVVKTVYNKSALLQKGAKAAETAIKKGAKAVGKGIQKAAPRTVKLTKKVIGKATRGIKSTSRFITRKINLAKGIARKVGNRLSKTLAGRAVKFIQNLIKKVMDILKQVLKKILLILAKFILTAWAFLTILAETAYCILCFSSFLGSVSLSGKDVGSWMFQADPDDFSIAYITYSDLVHEELLWAHNIKSDLQENTTWSDSKQQGDFLTLQELGNCYGEILSASTEIAEWIYNTFGQSRSYEPYDLEKDQAGFIRDDLREILQDGVNSKEAQNKVFGEIGNLYTIKDYASTIDLETEAIRMHARNSHTHVSDPDSDSIGNTARTSDSDMHGVMICDFFGLRGYRMDQPFDGALFSEYKITNYIDGGFMLEFRGKPAQGYTSNCANIVAMATVFFNQENMEEEKHWYDDTWIAGLANGFNKVINAISSWFADFFDMAELAARTSNKGTFKHGFAYVMGKIGKAVGVKSETQIYAAYTHPLFLLSHTEEYYLSKDLFLTKYTEEVGPASGISGDKDEIERPSNWVGHNHVGSSKEGGTGFITENVDSNSYGSEKIYCTNQCENHGYGCIHRRCFYFKAFNPETLWYHSGGPVDPTDIPDVDTEDGFIDVMNRVSPWDNDDHEISGCCALETVEDFTNMPDTGENGYRCWYGDGTCCDDTASQTETLESISALLDGLSLVGVSDSFLEYLSYSPLMPPITPSMVYLRQYDDHTIEGYLIEEGTKEDGQYVTKNGVTYYEKMTVPVYNYVYFKSVHYCKGNHHGYYCGGHLILRTRGIIYGFSKEQMEQEKNIPGKVVDDAQGKHPIYIVDSSSAKYYVNAVTISTGGQLGVTLVNGSSPDYDIDKDALDEAQDLFEVDRAIYRNNVAYHSGWEDWCADNINRAAALLQSDWEDQYNIESISFTIDGIATFSDEEFYELMDEMGNVNDIQYDANFDYEQMTPEEQEKWYVMAHLYKAIKYAGRMGYSQDHHSSHPLDQYFLSDCSGFASNIWGDVIGSVKTTSTLKDWAESFGGYKNFSDGGCEPGDILLSNVGTPAAHAMIYIGKKTENMSQPLGPFNASTKDNTSNAKNYIIHCSSTTGIKNGYNKIMRNFEGEELLDVQGDDGKSINDIHTGIVCVKRRTDIDSLQYIDMSMAPDYNNVAKNGIFDWRIDYIYNGNPYGSFGYSNTSLIPDDVEKSDVYQAFVNAGYTPQKAYALSACYFSLEPVYGKNMAVGMMANIMAEGNAGLCQGGRKTISSIADVEQYLAYGNTYNKAVGSCQWDGSRRTNLLNAYKAAYNADPNFSFTQEELTQIEVDYRMYELETAYKSVANAASAATSPEEAARIICLRYEIPAHRESAANLRAGYATDITQVLTNIPTS